MASVLALVGDQIYLTTVAIFAAASLGIIRWSRRRNRLSGSVALAGLRTATIAGVVSGTLFVIIVLALVLLLHALSNDFGDDPPPGDSATQILSGLFVLLWLVSVPGVTPGRPRSLCPAAAPPTKPSSRCLAVWRARCSHERVPAVRSGSRRRRQRSRGRA